MKPDDRHALLDLLVVVLALLHERDTLAERVRALEASACPS